MNRLQIVRPCPGVPSGLIEALDRDGEAHCERCGETVVDLRRKDAPTTGRVIRCARILVAAATLAGCAGAPKVPAEPRLEVDAGAPAPALQETPGFVFKDDPLLVGSYGVGMVELRRVDDGIPK